MDSTQNGLEEKKTVFETVPVEDTPPSQPSQNLKPEEIGSQFTADALENIPSPLDEDEGPKNKSKLVIIIAAVVVVLFVGIAVVAALAGGKKKEPVKLTYWGLWEEPSSIEPLIKEYQEKNPHVTIEYKKMSPEQYLVKLLRRVEEGEGPDIFRFHNTWVPILTKDVLAPAPSTVIKQDEFTSTFYAIHAKDLIVGKSIVGMPLTVDGLVIVYNPKILQALGVEAPPAEWDKLLALARQLTVVDGSGNIRTSGLAIGLSSNVAHFSDIFGWLLMQDGATKITDVTAATAGESLQSFRRLAEPDVNVWNSAMPNSIKAFAGEQVAMIFAPSWQIHTIKQLNPDIQLKTASLPKLPDGKPTPIASYWVEGVSKRSKNQVEAWKFLYFLASKESQSKMFELQSKTRLFGEPYARKDMGDLLKNNQYLGAVVAQGDDYNTLPMITNTWDEIFNDRINKYIENAINETSQGSDYTEAAKKIEQGIREVYSTLKIPLQ